MKKVVDKVDPLLQILPKKSTKPFFFLETQNQFILFHPKININNV